MDFQRSKVIAVIFLSKLFLCLSEVGQIFCRASYRGAWGLQSKAGAEKLWTVAALFEAR